MTASGPHFRLVVMQAKERLRERREKIRRQHEADPRGLQVSAALTDLLEGVVLDLYHAAVAEQPDDIRRQLDEETTLLCYGGFARRDAAPFSDVDLMLLHAPRLERAVEPVARRLVADVYDVGLKLGFSVRTASQARGLAVRDATVFTSLVDTRRLAGSAALYEQFTQRFQREARRRWRSLVSAIVAARLEERRQVGDTVYLLKPNVKRSLGGLRDIQLVRWIGMARRQLADPDALMLAGFLSKPDQAALRQAQEFLLRLRNELHFHAGKAHDVLDRDEQVRIAPLFGCQDEAGLLAVEQFMRMYFQHTSNVRNIVSNFVARSEPRWELPPALRPLVSHRVERDFLVGPRQISATPRGLAKVQSDLAETLRLMDLANLYDKRIDQTAWDAIRAAMVGRDDIRLTPAAIRRFLSILSQRHRLGDLLRRLHELRVLEKIIPGLSHARSLMQFNEYHKYTIDEHCLRAVECATSFYDDPGPLGEAYRNLHAKRTLHLALLLHDLGKGYSEDHSEVGARLAVEAAQRLGLSEQEGETLRFLVLKHLMMAHLAFRRDINDESLVVKFAVEVGSPEVLQLFYLLTAADLAAVGPGVLTEWKQQLLTDLYHRTLDYLSGGGASTRSRERVRELRRRLRGQVRTKNKAEADWWDEQIAALPPRSLDPAVAAVVIDELSPLIALGPQEVRAQGRWLPDRGAVEISVGANERIASGIFHRLTGALTSLGLQILEADIDTLARGLVLDRFYVLDKQHPQGPPPGRITEVCTALENALRSERAPVFRPLWGQTNAAPLGAAPTSVRIDNSTSDRFTIIDIFTHDRMGLLYTITRTIYELGLSVGCAKISTRLDQVVDVFYVTDERGGKITDEARLRSIRQTLQAALESAG